MTKGDRVMLAARTILGLTVKLLEEQAAKADGEDAVLLSAWAREVANLQRRAASVVASRTGGRS